LVVEKARTIPWLWAIYVSVLLWLAVAIGNIALFALRPAEHWPVLETIEGLQTASLIPIALLLHRINRRSRQSAVVTVVGILAMLLGAVLSFAFASELLTFGTGMIAVFGDTVALVGLLVWLFTTNVLAWRGRALPRNLALLGMAAAITITLLYPVWALWLAVILRRQAAVR
jgi:membrane-associated HD superfamily phosphohydrolase